jgi:hypothetical protein
VNHIEISHVNEEAAPLSENEHGVFFEQGIDQKQRASADAEIPEGKRNYAFALPFAGNPLNEESAEKKALADEAKYEEIIVIAILEQVAESVRVHCDTHWHKFPILKKWYKN